MSIEEIANSIFAATVCTTALYSKAIAHILDYYLHASRDAILEEIVGISKKVRGTQGDGLLLKFAREALRECSESNTYHIEILIASLLFVRSRTTRKYLLTPTR